MKPTHLLFPVFFICAITLSACNLPMAKTPAAEATTSSGTSLPVTSTPTTTPGPAIIHVLTPGEGKGNIGKLVYDSESYSTASLKYAATGDLYHLNRFERPFTQNQMDYLSYLDIHSFNTSKDADWYYAFVEMEDLSSPVAGLEPIYGLEIDYDLDGRGDYLIWAKPPFTTDWDTLPVSVYADPNHNVGGPNPEKADPSDQAGDGYEKTLLDAGHGDDPDIAWVRISPDDPNTIQFAFKKSLAPEGFFEWTAWADGSTKDPAKFAYNDRMSLEDAGSPLKNDANYPLKALFAVDSTCYNPYGTGTGYLPMICPQEIPPTRRPPQPNPQTPVPTLPPVPTVPPPPTPIPPPE
jgi:hypothetical protein